MDKRANVEMFSGVSADTFAEWSFEGKFKIHAKRFGDAGDALCKGRLLTDDELGCPDENQEFDSEDYKNVTKYKTEQEMRADMKANSRLEEIGILTTGVKTIVKVKFKDFKPELFKTKMNAFAKREEKYRNDMRDLCADLLLRLDKSLLVSTQTHAGYKKAYDENNIVDLFEIVVEQATGKSNMSVYMLISKFLALKQRSNKYEDFTEYIKQYNECIADLLRASGGDPREIWKWLVNAKFIEGLNQEQFAEQVRSIMGQAVWPDAEILQKELVRYATATRGMQMISKSQEQPNEGLILSNAARGSQSTFLGTCHNCGNKGHRASECTQDAHKCKICGKTKHLEKSV